MSFIISELFDVENVVTLRSHSRLLEMVPFDRSHTSSYSSSTVIKLWAYLLSFLDKARYWLKRSYFFHTPSAEQSLWGNRFEYFRVVLFTTETDPSLPGGANGFRKSSLFTPILTYSRALQTDRRDIARRHNPFLCIASRGKKRCQGSSTYSTREDSLMRGVWCCNLVHGRNCWRHLKLHQSSIPKMVENRDFCRT